MTDSERIEALEAEVANLRRDMDHVRQHAAAAVQDMLTGMTELATMQKEFVLNFSRDLMQDFDCRVSQMEDGIVRKIDAVFNGTERDNPDPIKIN